MATIINWGAFYAQGGYNGEHDPLFYEEDYKESVDDINEYFMEEK